MRLGRVRTMSTTCASAYSKVASHLREISALQGIEGLLGWDELVMQPDGAADTKGKQKSALAGVLYDKKTDKEFGALLVELEGKQDELASEVERANIKMAAKAYKRMTALPKDLSQRIAELETEGYHSWVSARQASDYSKFKPSLQEWVDISKKKAALIDPTSAAYDVLVEDYEKGMTAARIDEIFAKVREGVVPLIKDIREKGTPPDADWLKGTYDTKKQAELCESIALDLGFDLKKGRLDVSVHPFTGGTDPTDVRMTTRFKEEDVTEGLTGAIHETGHALYEQGRNLDPAWEGLPVNAAHSMGVHESQSLLWERMVALGLPFQSYLLPKLRAFFPEQVPADATPERLYGAVNLVKFPSLIRVESDEVTYSLHVILRYEIERALVDGSLAVDDVPRVWNAKMKDYLAADVPSDAVGVLQDVHWSAGAIGYFPTYTLGAMIAVQIFHAARAALPALDEQIARGEFAPLKAWLNEHVHRRGSLHNNFDELLQAVTGKPLDPDLYVDYLRTKYSKLYGF